MALLLLASLLLSAAAPSPTVAEPSALAASSTPQSSDAHTTFSPYTSFYGLYVGGKKVGYMHATLRLTPRVVMGFTLKAKVAGMGRVSEVELCEEREFNVKTHVLERIAFEQRSDTGAVQVQGVRQGASMVLTTKAGGGEHIDKVLVDERLEDDMALVTLARGKDDLGGKVGERAEVRHLDPASQSMVQAQMCIDAVDNILVGGVAQQVRRITTRYPSLKVKEQSAVDAQGKLLSTQIGGFFEARLEDEEVAKLQGTVQDVLLGAVVKVPRPLDGVSSAGRLHLQLGGLDADDVLPSGGRQQVQRRGSSEATVQLQRDPAWSGTYVAPWRAKKAAAAKLRYPEEVRTALRPTPYLQSEAKEIVAMAKAAVGEATQLKAVIERLCSAVHGHLRAKYVPAFSNALEAYHSRRGDCTEYSVLLAAVARAAGLPARPVVGVAYWPAGGGFGWHAWVEVWSQGRWRQVDPTWNQPVADVTHLKLADGGPAEQASVVMLLGRLQLLDWQLPAP